VIKKILNFLFNDTKMCYVSDSNQLPPPLPITHSKSIHDSGAAIKDKTIKIMNTEINKLQQDIDSMRASLTALESKIKAEKLAEESRRFKVGDYVVNWLSRAGPFKVFCVNQDTIMTKENGLFGFVLASFYQKATNEEITDYLISEAKNIGFEIGKRVKCKGLQSVYTIKDLYVTFKGGPIAFEDDPTVYATVVNGHALYRWKISDLVLIKEDIYIDNGSARHFVIIHRGHITISSYNIENSDIRKSFKVIKDMILRSPSDLAAKFGNIYLDFAALKAIVEVLQD